MINSHQEFDCFVSEINDLIPTEHHVFNAPQPLPYAVWYEDDAQKICADGKIIFLCAVLKLEVYTKKSDKTTIPKINALFDKWGAIPKIEPYEYIASEKCCMTTYKFTIQI